MAWRILYRTRRTHSRDAGRSGSAAHHTSAGHRARRSPVGCLWGWRVASAHIATAGPQRTRHSRVSARVCPDAWNGTAVPRFKLTLEYCGAGLVGWQRQANGLSVQHALETAIHEFCGEAVTV